MRKFQSERKNTHFEGLPYYRKDGYIYIYIYKCSCRYSRTNYNEPSIYYDFYYYGVIGTRFLSGWPFDVRSEGEQRFAVESVVELGRLNSILAV